MARPLLISPRRPRVSLDVDLAIRRRLRMAAAKRDVTVRRYILEAIEERLLEDLGGEAEPALSSRTDPVLGELWDNVRDAAYDRLRSR